MKTVTQKLIEELVNNLLTEEEATEVVEMTKQANADVGVRWESQADGYPPFMIRTLFVAAKRQAVIYLEKNKPHHFALPHFKGEIPA